MSSTANSRAGSRLTTAQWEFQPAPQRWSAAEIVEHVVTVQDIVRAKLDGHQWIPVSAAHTERHTKQILEVIADSAFPLQ